MNLSGYRQAVTQLRNASRGSYGGPSISPVMLQQAYDSVEGVDTGELRVGARLAAGSTQTAGVQQWLLPVAKFIGSLGAGMVASELVDKAQSWFSSRDEAEEVADAAGRAADAIDLTLLESERGTEAILAQLLEIITQLSQHLASIDPSEHPEAFTAVVQAGADIIGDAAAMILGLCADRDKAIEECYCALIEHGTRVCEQPAPQLVDAAPAGSSGAGSGTGAVSGGGAAVVTEPAGNTGAAEEPPPPPDTPPATTPAAVGEQTEDAREEKTGKKGEELTPEEETSEETPVTPEETTSEEEQDCENDSENAVAGEAEEGVEEAAGTAEPGGEEALLPAAEPTGEQQTRNTIIGAIGVGLLVAGVGALVHFVEQAVQDFLAAMTPEVESPAEAAPAEPAPIETEPVEPVPEPLNDKKTEADLAQVPEPPAKPMPAAVQAHSVHTPAPAPQPAPPQVPQPVPAPVGDQGQMRVRKAGGWT